MVVIAHLDGLAKYARWQAIANGVDLFRWLGEQNRCKLVVLNQTSLSPKREIFQDILAILHCFSS